VRWDGTGTADETGHEWCRGIKSAGVFFSFSKKTSVEKVES
jgi:hypothetical protein